MSDLLSGLSSMGLQNLEGLDLFETQKKPEQQDKKEETPLVQEKDMIYDRNYECPVCDTKFTSKTVKAGKSKLVHTDQDLRPVYDGIDIVKYDVIVCPHCGHAALTRYFKPLPSVQVRLIKENISANFKMQFEKEETTSYPEAFKRYQLALANAIVKKAHASEKAYICLKSGWLLRGWQETLKEDIPEQAAQKKDLAQQEDKYLSNALEGFVNAVQTENFPICGMDETTVDYLMAVLSLRFKKYDVASKLIGNILTSNIASPRMKDKTRNLKEQVLQELKNNKQESV